MATKFRLSTLLRIRERERDAAAKLVQDVHTAIERMNQAQREVDQEHDAMNRMRRESSSGPLALQQVLDAQRYQMVLAAQAAQIAENQGKLRQELERRQALLLKCQQAVKSLEKLREQRATAAETLALAKQQERLDEWSSIQSAMKSHSDRDNHG